MKVNILSLLIYHLLNDIMSVGQDMFVLQINYGHSFLFFSTKAIQSTIVNKK